LCGTEIPDEMLEAEPTETLAVGEAFVSAVAAKLAGSDPATARKTGTL
jgi:hypothetical protein